MFPCKRSDKKERANYLCSCQEPADPQRPTMHAASPGLMKPSGQHHLQRAETKSCASQTPKDLAADIIGQN